jgi:hypothetical protein
MLSQMCQWMGNPCNHQKDWCMCVLKMIAPALDAIKPLLVIMCKGNDNNNHLGDDVLKSLSDHSARQPPAILNVMDGWGSLSH